MGITFIIWRFLNHGGTPIAGCLFAGKSTPKINDFGVHPWIGQLRMMMVITMVIVVIIVFMMLIIRMIMNIVYNDYWNTCYHSDENDDTLCENNKT